mmetsp:Transcript_25611/g.52119  ORF Transcript_25611/g.52119 Transcript_25611/m.52119 type:complete len:226 (+) Transcript_25611:88-765(+)
MLRYMTSATASTARAVLPRLEAVPAISTFRMPIYHSFYNYFGVDRIISFSLPGYGYRTYTSTTINSKEIDRPFQILGLQQIAVGSLSKESMSNIWIDVFGIKKAGSYTSEKENVDEDILKLGPDGSPYVVEVDLMTPLDAEKRPKVHSPPLNHIGLWVDDLPKAVTWMQEKGVRFTPGGIRKGAAGHDVTFIHPKGNEDSPIGGAGVLIELVQAPTEVIDALKPK